MTTSRSFTLLCFTAVFCFISYNMVRMPVLALFAQSLGASPERIGFIVSASTLMGVFLKLPSGALSDIYGRRILLQAGVVAFGLPPFFYLWVTDVDSLTVLRFVHGLATAIFAPSALATVADFFSGQRGAALGMYSASTQCGALLGPFFGGYLIYTSGFSFTFLVAGLCGCVAIVIFYTLQFTLPPPRIHEKSLAQLLSEMWGGFREVAKNRTVLVTSSTDAAKMIANGALMAFLPLYGISEGLNPGEVGLLFSIQAVTSLVSKPIMGRVSDRFGRQPLIVIGLVICALSFVCIPQTSTFWVLLLFSAGFGFGEAVVSSSSSALIADSLKSNALGAGMGMQGTIGDVGHASGPLLAGVLIAHLNYAHAFIIIAGLQLVAAVVFWIAMRRSALDYDIVHHS